MGDEYRGRPLETQEFLDVDEQLEADDPNIGAGNAATAPKEPVKLSVFDKVWQGLGR